MLKQQSFSFWSCWDARLFLSFSVTVFAALLFLYNIVKKSKKSIAPLSPGPWGVPEVGYLQSLGTFLHKKFTQLAGVYDPIYKLWLGNKLCIVISSPSLAKEVIRDNDKISAKCDPPISARVLTHNGNDIAWSSQGLDSPEWKKLRKVFVRELLSNASLDACYSLRKQEVHKAIKNLYNKFETR